jgi:REP element-mobilizing transposase RayT
LNRSVQDPSTFQCRAFQPLLSLAVKSTKRSANSYESLGEKVAGLSERFVNSEKVKYERALAIQRLNRESDGIFIELKYHLAWNVAHRSPIFGPGDQIFESIYDIFLRCSDTVRGFVNMLWLAPDHVHLYVESFGDYSVENMVQKINRQSKQGILDAVKSIEKGLGEGNDLWDSSYFVQSIG